MKKNAGIRFLFFLLLAVFFGVVILSIEIRDMRKLNSQYQILRYEDEIMSRISSIKYRKGICFVEVENQKVVFRPSSNENYIKEYLRDNIFPGDSLLKRSYSDTIHIYRDRDTLLFVHNNVIRIDNSKTP